MARLTKEQVTQEIESKGFKVHDISGYKNLSSEISIECEKGHITKTTLKDIRKSTFSCDQCFNSSEYKATNIDSPPMKTGFRIVAFDQSSKTTGISVYDNGSLVFRTSITAIGSLDVRLVKWRRFLQDKIISEWAPDFIGLEDIFKDEKYKTFKALAMTLGVFTEVIRANNIEYETVMAKVWKSHSGVAGKNRTIEKRSTIRKVNSMYGIVPTEDEADAILIGRYLADKHSDKWNRAFG